MGCPSTHWQGNKKRSYSDHWGGWRSLLLAAWVRVLGVAEVEGGEDWLSG